jgi:hypothetical protein
LLIFGEKCRKKGVEKYGGHLNLCGMPPDRGKRCGIRSKTSVSSLVEFLHCSTQSFSAHSDGGGDSDAGYPLQAGAGTCMAMMIEPRP